MALTVSGPNDLDLTLPSHYGPGAALSRAVTEAERGALAEASYYVRRDGEIVGRVDREQGQTIVRSKEALDRGAEDANLEGEPARARATGSASEASSTRRPGSPRRRTKEEPKVAEKTKSKSAGKTRSGGRSRSAPAPKTVAAAPAAPTQETPAEAAAGSELYESLLAEVKSVVQGLEAKENKSKTYTRLLKGGKAFAYIFPPRRGGVALKIPKQLLAVARELPEGHGFKTTGWGLTRTLNDPAETQVVAKALGVAAKAVAAK